MRNKTYRPLCPECFGATCHPLCPSGPVSGIDEPYCEHCDDTQVDPDDDQTGCRFCGEFDIGGES